ncbi:hypothetical protein C4D60_Mb01t27880 [Musa balbisiana]|uniref:Uncharacterized protein n=1 Tax=Musa balbisiana TaxID=52838 RepID=A0A4S8JR99_MUSBA|nr:hypothetical protein C4D60_Mb01t27880 [Musa balbisiana]
MRLRGLVREWCTHLKLLLVGSFAQLTKEFKLYYLRNVCLRLSMVMLLEVKQGEEETLFDLSLHSPTKSEVNGMSGGRFGRIENPKRDYSIVA